MAAALASDKADAVRTVLKWYVDTRHGGNQKAAALTLGVAQPTVNDALNNKKGPGLKILEALAHALDETIDGILLMRPMGGSAPQQGSTPRPPSSREREIVTSVPHFEPPDWVMTPLLKAVQKHPELDVSNALIKATAWALARDSAKREQQLDVRECEQALLIAADLVAEGVDISANPLEIMYESLRRAHRADPRTARNDAAFEAALAAEREDPSRQRPPRKGAKGGGRA
jgi:transcriptional regulator with XRE-family HTH domain